MFSESVSEEERRTNYEAVLCISLPSHLLLPRFLYPIYYEVLSVLPTEQISCLSASDSHFAVGLGLRLVSGQADACRRARATQRFLLLPWRVWKQVVGMKVPQETEAVWMPKLQGAQLPRKASQLCSGHLPGRALTLFRNKVPGGWVLSHHVPLLQD